MNARTALVLHAHRSEYPRPITFDAGAPLTVGQRYEGPEGWEDWWWCETPGQDGGWVPAQVIEVVDGAKARAREAYTARELDADPGETVLVTRTLNSWAWCEKPSTGESGWVPVACLQWLEG
ncbi:MAG: SH3 domain-containing protein [Ideonella sp.]|nr:SH3 domain-containing protein [Ideonella sp.]